MQDYLGLVEIAVMKKNKKNYSKMAIQNLRKRAIKIINNQKFKIISETTVEVTEDKETYSSIYLTKPGRTIQTCSCPNYQKHCKQPIRCVHMLVAEWVLMLHQLNNENKE